ncbi:MAG: fimbrillin family protein [Bacteroides sp.]
MKTTYRIISVLVASLCLLCACSSSLDEELTLNSYAPLTLSVSVGNYTPTGSGVQTRAANANAYPFTFRNGDQLGIIALQNGEIVEKYNNIPFTYQDGKWASTPPLPFSSAYQYLVYYPYQKDMANKTTKAAIIAAFTPKTDQSSEGNHRASDLLVCDLITPAITDKTLNVTFQHALSLLVIPPVKANITSEGTAYQCGLPFTDARITAGTGTGTDTKDCSSYVASDGTARLIVKPQTDASLTSHFTYDNKSYSSSAGSVTLLANYCYAFKELETTFTYNFENAQVGDFYCNTTTTSGTTGYLIPNNAVSFPNDMKCIGLVFKMGKDNSDDGNYIAVNGTSMSPLRGYVVALQDAGIFAWANKGGAYDFSVGTSTGDSDWKGYSNCQKMKEGTGHDWNITHFPAANACITFGTAAPTESSGWFLPSCGQLLSLYYNGDLLSGQINKLKTISSYVAISWFLPFNYWSSSERLYSSSISARYVYFGGGSVHSNYKSYGNNVRSILAF